MLQQILSDQNLDDKLARILAHLEKLKTDLEEERVPISLLAITKQLTKNPEEYPDKKSLPHVQVALRMNTMRTKKFKQGDAIAYVICQVSYLAIRPSRKEKVLYLTSRARIFMQMHILFANVYLCPHFVFFSNGTLLISEIPILLYIHIYIFVA